MIEEAAGTRLYDDKKEEAKREITKKTQKLQDDETLIKEQLQPRMSKMEKERQTYIEYQQRTREREHLDRVCTAYRYYATEEMKAKSEADMSQAQNEGNELKKRLADIHEAKANLKKEVHEIEKELDKKHSGTLENARKSVQEAEKVYNVCRSDMENAKQTVDDDKAQQTKLLQQRNKDLKLVDNKTKEMNALTGGDEALKKRNEAQARLESASSHVDALTVGISTGKSNGNNHRSLEATLADLNQKLAEAETELKRLQLGIKTDELHLNGSKSKLKNERAKSEYASLQKEVESHQKAVAETESRLKGMGFDVTEGQNRLSQLKDFNVQAQQLKNKVSQLESRCPRLAFDYNDPEPNFNRSRVLGVVAKLFRMNDPKFSVALEEASSGKIYNIVVDTEETGKLLLQKGGLRQRVTMIPLNKIQPFVIPDETVRFAQKQFGADKVYSALSLVTSEDERANKALQFVFGGTLICTDANIARNVAYHEKIMRRVVTLQGDVFDPSGVISGGHRGNREDVLGLVAQIKVAQKDLSQCQSQIQDAEKQVAKMRQSQEMANQLEIAKNSLSSSEERLKLCTYSCAQTDLKRLEDEIASKRSRITELSGSEKGSISAFKKEIVDVEKRIADYNPERELQNARKEMDAAKKALDKINKEMEKSGAAAESLRAEIAALTSGISEHDKRLADFEEDLKRHQQKLDEAQAKVEKCGQEAQRCRDVLDEAERSVASVTAAIRERNSKITKLDEERNTIEISQQEIKHRFQRSEKAVAEADATLRALTEDHDWIEAEKRTFGQPGSMYDFHAASFDASEIMERSKSLAASISKLEKRLNPQVMAQLKRTEEDYKGAIERRQTVLRDREKLLETMNEVDEARNDAIWAAYTKVNKDFAEIFGTLLPGARAMLAANEAVVNGNGQGKRKELVGVEFRVGFGKDAWKESLSELSGGQRSLVALSLILSLLRFRPAPLYILDEIDAALDLSHTQNIGRIIREKFANAQFIIVSLKEGMFSNANVIFQTKFQDGVSTVTRITGKKDGRHLKKKEDDSSEIMAPQSGRKRVR